jgi:hypothetical protein
LTEGGRLVGYVFGYGSLVVEDDSLAGAGGPAVPPVWGTIDGYRRRWNVAMDNTAGENDEKHFVDAATGERPSIFVAWLNIEQARDVRVNGLAIPVTDRRLEEFDRRERSYDRADVTTHFAPDLGLPVWTYVGDGSALARFMTGLREGNVYISRAYVELVRDAFSAAGQEELARYEASTLPVECPMRELVLVREGRPPVAG